MLIRGGGGGYIEGVTRCRAALKTENVGNGVGLLHLNRIFRTFGAGLGGACSIPRQHSRF
jgi:hypothetical protein